jgi:hypothetical protein
MKEKLARFFWGRYGMDQLGWALVIASMVLTFLSSVFGSSLLLVISYVPLVLAILRILSRNVNARMRENQKFLAYWKPVKKWCKLQYSKLRDIRTHRYFSCPNCKNALRVPKGRGQIMITCPVCRTRFDAKS